MEIHAITSTSAAQHSAAQRTSLVVTSYN